MSNSNPYAAPQAEVKDITPTTGKIDIDSLPISDKWKLKLHAIDKAGGPKLPQIKTLSSAERRRVSFNILAFLFGPIYYAWKGMWKKGLSLLAACFLAILVIATIMELVGWGRFADALGYGASAIFAVRANIDYYKKMVLNLNGWW